MSDYKKVVSKNIRPKVQGKDPIDVLPRTCNFTESKVLEFF